MLILTEIFSQKTFDLIKKNIDQFDYFFILEEHNFWQMDPTFPLVPDYQLRFFKKDSVIWPSKIHPIPQTKGQGFTVPDEEDLAIEHYNYDNLSQYFEKSLRYAKGWSKKIGFGK